MSMVGLGSDYGGSLRWPAQCAGLVGLRPSVGRVPRTGEQPGDDFRDEVGRSFQDTVQVVGPIGRTVADVHTVLQVISGPDGHDPLVSNAPLLDFRDVELDQLELAWAPTVAGVRVDDEITSAVESAVNVLRRLGATIVHGVPDAVNDGLRVYDRLRAAEPMTAVARLHHRHPELVGDAIKSMLRSRVLLSGSELTDLWAERDHLISALAEWLKGRRALILPVSTGAPRDLTGHVADFHLLSPSRAISLFGVPAASVPVAVSTHGSPISVQVVAPAFREDVALAVCAHLSEQFKHAPVDWTEATGAR
jgi:amidase